MWFYMKLAWRNILRNKRRTIIAGISIGIGLAAVLLHAAVTKGMISSMITTTTSSFIGDAQIHQNRFRDTQDVEKTISNLDDVVQKLKHEPLVSNFTLRTISMGMISSPANVNAALLVGINPETEQNLSLFDEAIKYGKGDFFKGTNPRDIVIGSKMAEILEVGLGDRIVVTVAQVKTGDLSQEMFRISGIYHFGIKSLDANMMFIRLPRAQEMLGIPGQVHQIAIKFHDTRTALNPNLPFWKTYSANSNEAVSWITLMPQLDMMLKMSAFGTLIIIIILGALVTFGIINVLFMSLYERMFEFGVLRAVGTRPGGIRKLIILEAGALGLISIAIGITIGFLITFILIKTGLDYRGIEMGGMVFQDLLYPEIEWWHYVVYPIGVLVFTVLVGLYPAWVGGRMRISDAIRKSL